MELTIQKSFEETIQIETPRYFKSKYMNRLARLTETGLIKISDDSIFYSDYDPKCNYFKKDVFELLNEYIEVSKDQFESMASTTLLKMQSKAYE